MGSSEKYSSMGFAGGTYVIWDDARGINIMHQCHQCNIANYHRRDCVTALVTHVFNIPVNAELKNRWSSNRWCPATVRQKTFVNTRFGTWCSIDSFRYESQLKTFINSQWFVYTGSVWMGGTKTRRYRSTPLQNYWLMVVARIVHYCISHLTVLM